MTIAETLGALLRDEPDPQRHVEMIRAAVDPIRFEDDKSGYYFVYDGTVNVALPTAKDKQGTDLAASRTRAACISCARWRSWPPRAAGSCSTTGPSPARASSPSCLTRPRFPVRVLDRHRRVHRQRGGRQGRHRQGHFQRCRHEHDLDRRCAGGGVPGAGAAPGGAHRAQHHPAYRPGHPRGRGNRGRQLRRGTGGPGPRRGRAPGAGPEQHGRHPAPQHRRDHRQDRRRGRQGRRGPHGPGRSRAGQDPGRERPGRGPAARRPAPGADGGAHFRRHRANLGPGRRDQERHRRAARPHPGHGHGHGGNERLGAGGGATRVPPPSAGWTCRPGPATAPTWSSAPCRP